jgi:type IV pilus assembly protein PilY1
VYYREGAEYGKHYGLDGPITAFIHNDTELNAGKTSSKSLISANDKAYMYAGMRRGGEVYYALDVTDPKQPTYLWQITSDDTGFERLGQTWSAMKPIYVSPEAIGIDVEPQDSKPIPVLVFGGGYDPVEDDTSGGTRISHSRGNAIYMVNALTGDLLWTASPDSSADLTVNGMTNSIVSDITAVDNDGNGTTDILYAADTGGRIWRIDLFSNNNPMATEVADLNDGSIANNTRFYTSPVVAYNDELDSYVIAIGSGYRAHPLVTDNKDRFFVIIDDKTTTNRTDLKQQLNTYRTIELDDLADSGSLAVAADSDLLNGFYLDLETTGEKALTDAIIADNVVYFGTYSPVVTSASSGLESCSAATGATNLYSVDFSAYNPGDNSPVVVIEQTELKQTGIPAEPKIVFPPSKSGSDPDTGDGGGDGGECASLAILIGSESVALDSCTTVSRNYWREL